MPLVSLGDGERPFEDGERVAFDSDDGESGLGVVVTVTRPTDDGYPTQTPPTALGDWLVLVQPDESEDSIMVLARHCRTL